MHASRARRRASQALGLLAVLLAATAAGCLDDGGIPDEGQGGPLDAPTWHVGDWWRTTSMLPDGTTHTSRLVVATVDDPPGHYQLSVSDEAAARRHAVLNHNPFLGRLTMHALQVYENGIAQDVLSFPLDTTGPSWTFDLLGVAGWQARVTDQGGKGSEAWATIEATSGVHSLAYTYRADAGWITSLTWHDDAGPRLSIVVEEDGSGHTGECFFIRASDMHGGHWQASTGAPDIELYDTFLDSGHPRDGAFDLLIVHLSADVADEVDAAAALAVRDHTSTTVLQRTWQRGQHEDGSVHTIPSTSDEYSLTVMLTGQTEVRMLVAGGIEYSWTLT